VTRAVAFATIKRKDSAGREDTASMITGGGYVGSHARQQLTVVKPTALPKNNITARNCVFCRDKGGNAPNLAFYLVPGSTPPNPTP
jgi:hypothetical protein